MMQMESRPVVTVLVCLYNGARYIDEALQSVFRQTCQAFEVVVIDDGSTDGGADAIERCYKDERLKVVRRPHMGLHATRAASLDYAGGKYVAFLDQDDVWLPTKLERQIATAEASPEAGLIFSDCVLIDEAGQPLGLLSERHRFDPSSVIRAGHLELLRRGCFVCFSTAFARFRDMKAIGGFNDAYQYAADYDLWLRLARHHPLAFIDEPLAKYRVHPTQFTQRHPEITLPEQVAILEPMRRSASYPADVRTAIGDNLLGQHWLALQIFLRQRRFVHAALAAVGMLRYPDRMRGWVRARLSRTPLGPAVDLIVRSGLFIGNEVRRVVVMSRRAPRRLLRTVTGRGHRPQPSHAPVVEHVWFDGTVLAAAQVGHFNMTCELIRALAERGYAVHVATNGAGRAAIDARLNGHRPRIVFERPGSRFQARRRRAPVPNATEVVVWRGRFRWRDARHVAIIPDLTTQIHPELHTPENIAEFDGFVQYAQRHAHGIATLSEASRHDIIQRIPVCPASVGILPMPVHPQYVTPVFSRGVIEALGVVTPYVLCVGTIEPRKNLRRLVHAFHALRDDVTAGHTLMIAGPLGWDATFGDFLRQTNASAIRLPGYVPLESLPSLYHFASAVAYPSVYEGFGLPVLEAMCCSAVVVASNVSAVPEVLGSGAIYFDPYDVDDLARALRAALTLTPAEEATYRTRNRARACAHLERLRTEAPLPGLRSGAIEAT